MAPYLKKKTDPRSPKYGIFTYIWLIFMVHVGKKTIQLVFGDLTKKKTRHENKGPPKKCPEHLGTKSAGSFANFIFFCQKKTASNNLPVAKL